MRGLEVTLPLSKITRTASAKRVATFCLRLLYWLIIVMIALVVYFLFLYVSNISSFERGSVGAMVYGTAHRPYVYRTLLPSTVRLIVPFVSNDVVEVASSNPLIEAALSRFDSTNYPVESLLMLVGMFLCLLGFVWSLRFLMRSVGYLHWTVNWFPIICLLLLPSFFPDGKYYDWPTLFLFTLGLALLTRQQWVVYILVFTLATINKETSIFLTMAFTVYFYRRLERRHFVYLLGIQSIIFVTVRLLLLQIFQNNPGAAVEFHLSEHLFAVQANPLAVLTPLAMFAVLISRRWQEKPEFLRHALVIVLPLGIMQLLFGIPYEIRVYLEVFPVVLLLVAGGILRSSMLYQKSSDLPTYLATS